jgi:hypothetical protein
LKLGWIFLITAIFATSLAPFSINDAQATGTLYGLAFSGSDGPADFYSIDPETGVPTFIGSTGFERCGGMDFLGATLYATCERADGSDIAVLVTINTSDGAATEVAVLNGGLSHSFGTAYSDISFRNSDGLLYAYLESNDGLGTIDITNGDLTELGSSSSNSCCGNGIAFDLADTLHHTTEDPLNTLDQTSGTATFVTDLIYSLPMDNFPRINAMDLDPWTGVMYGACNDRFGGPPENHLCTIDLTSGVVTVLGQTVDGLDAIAFANEVVTVVAGELLSIDNTSLLLSGIQLNAIWMIPAIIGSAGLGTYFLHFRLNKK